MRPWLAVAFLGLAGCASDPTIADRGVPDLGEGEALVAPPAEERPATAEDLLGAWTSVSRSGAWADAGLQFLYVFNADGSWHSSVVVDQEGQSLDVVVLSGRYKMDGPVLQLGSGAPPQQARIAGDRLSLESELGRLELELLDLPVW